ncbi:3'-5' exonuclease [Sphaerisporangium perillae]|uniref:3'-5' exonuclease n=1 Tax=Sphaerisporangium perillae TaxID=2935860 RepID=UPI002010BB82|nr:exonuclease domain-containing protein [Sphaerisporangium perillae]
MVAHTPRYAVVDVETTGFRTSEQDRVVEIAIVHAGPSGEVTGEWATLVDPGRDPGPESVHGITAADLGGAPAFGEIAGTVAALLRGRIVTAHNLPFDARFLAYEFRLLGFEVPVHHRLGVCTMAWGAHFLPGAPSTLAGCCALAGIPLDGNHEALVDARAAAGLLRHYIERAAPVVPWRHLFHTALDAPWPEVPDLGTPWVPRRDARTGPRIADASDR